MRLLYDEHAGPLYAFCLRWTGDAQRAEDVVQEVFLRAWRNLTRLDLETRREGDVLGVDQSGRRSGLRLLSVIEHEDVIADARRTADAIVRADPMLLTNMPLAAAVHRVGESQGADYLEKS